MYISWVKVFVSLLINKLFTPSIDIERKNYNLCFVVQLFLFRKYSH